MIPPQEYLHPGHLPIRHIDHRLEVKEEFVTFKCMSQIDPERVPLDRTTVHLWCKELVVITTTLLCVVHRDIAILQQNIDLLAIVWEECDPDTGTDMKFLSMDIIGLHQSMKNLLSDHLCII